jgi:iron complex transport system ATP-binding protein
MLRTENIHYSVGSKKILQGISVDFEPGLFHVIVGPNGSGKSTFLKVFSGESKPQQGNIFYNDQSVFKINKNELAKHRAVMSQQPEVHFPLIVSEVVMMGRYPHFDFRPDREDEVICKHAMTLADVIQFADRDYLTLSGGEKQRVHFARVLAQVGNNDDRDKFLFLDEAVSHLDLKHQKQLLEISKKMCDKHFTAIAILHDINLSLSFADRILFMKQGQIVYEAKSHSEVTTEIIKDVFDVDSKIIDPGNGHRPVVVF